MNIKAHLPIELPDALAERYQSDMRLILHRHAPLASEE